MTQHADGLTPDIEDLLRALVSASARIRSDRTKTMLRILAMTEWSVRTIWIVIAALIAIAVAVTLTSGGEATASGNPTPSITAPAQTKKTHPLFSRRDLIERGQTQPGQIQNAAPFAAIDFDQDDHFAFIRGGLDDVALTWTPVKPPPGISPLAEPRQKTTRNFRSRRKPSARAAATQKHPWLIDLIVRHMARGS